MPLLILERQLAQRFLTTTADSIVYQPIAAITRARIKTIVICNVTGSSATYSLYINQNGTVSGNQFALFKGRALAANTTDTFTYPDKCAVILEAGQGSLIVAAGTANAITVTLFGEEISET